ncbi:MAG: (d)CMP kinase [Bacteroidales bacterium]|nr:(d)CMP kinase [Bacteroidales bacterium]
MEPKHKLTIAIDGYSSCGKSTMAKALAKKLHYTYIDSGAMYRAVTLYCIKNNLARGSQIDLDKLEQQMANIHIDFRINSSTKESETYLNNQLVESRIRSIDVSNLVSPVSKISFVRKALVSQQRAFEKNTGIVMDGRDIGTVVFPDADLKIFMTADVQIRAQRRYDELIEKGQEVSMELISKNIEQRDYIDSHRDISPLRQATDAIVLDNSTLTREEQLQWIIDIIEKRFDKA